MAPPPSTDPDTSQLVFHPDALWPGSVPSNEEALKVLGLLVEVPDLLAPATERISRTLSEGAKGILAGELMEFDTTTLLQAIAVRWRMAVANDLRPKDASRVDTAALEQLVEDSDRALQALVPPAGAPPEVKAIFATERTSLIRDAVSLTEQGHQQVQSAAKSAVTTAGKKYEHMNARVAVHTRAAGQGSRPWMEKLLPVAIALAVAMGGWWLFLHLRTPSFPGALHPTQGTVLTGGGAGSAVQLVHTEDGNPFDGATLDALRAQATAAGRALERIGPGEALLVSPPGKADHK